MSDRPTLEPTTPTPPPWDYRAPLCLLLGTLAGWLGWRLHLPLSWLLGPLIVTAIFSIAGARVFAPLRGRRFGQLLIGASVGLQLTGPVLANLLGWFPVMAATATGSILIASFLSAGFARITGLDRKTAFLATIPGGLSEMANIAANVGARPEPVVVTQTFRVALVVLIVPPLLLLFADDVDFNAWISVTPIRYEWLPAVIATGAVGASALRRIRFQNPWMIGPLVAVAFLAASGIVDGRMPPVLIILAQILLGIAIGARFKGDIVKRLAHLSLVGGLMTIALTIVIAFFAGLMSVLFGLDFADLMLGASPGGFSEMTLTAQVLHANVTLVAGFHIVRSLLVNGMAMQIFTTLDRIHFFAFCERLFLFAFRK